MLDEQATSVLDQDRLDARVVVVVVVVVVERGWWCTARASESVSLSLGASWQE